MFLIKPQHKYFQIRNSLKHSKKKKKKKFLRIDFKKIFRQKKKRINKLPITILFALFSCKNCEFPCTTAARRFFYDRLSTRKERVSLIGRIS